MPHDESDELEGSFKPETGKAVIEGKTAVLGKHEMMERVRGAMQVSGA